MSGQPWRRFALGNVPAPLVWAAGFTAAGHLAGASYERASADVGSASAVLGLSVLVVVALLGTGRWVARHPEPVTTAVCAVAAWRPVRAVLRGRGSWLTWLSRRSGTVVAVVINFAVTVIAAAILAVTAVLATRAITAGVRADLLDDLVAEWMAARRDAKLLGAGLAFASALQTPLVLLVAAVLSLLAVPRTWARFRGALSTRSLIAVGGLFLPLALLSWVTNLLTGDDDRFAGLDGLYFTQVAVVTCAATLTAWRAGRDSAWTVAATWWTAAGCWSSC